MINEENFEIKSFLQNESIRMCINFTNLIMLLK